MGREGAADDIKSDDEFVGMIRLTTSKEGVKLDKYARDMRELVGGMLVKSDGQVSPWRRLQMFQKEAEPESAVDDVTETELEAYGRIKDAVAEVKARAQPLRTAAAEEAENAASKAREAVA